MKRVAFTATLCVLISLSANMAAQDFGTLIEAVDQMESNLTQLIENEKAARQGQLADLRAEIKKMDGSAGPDLSAEMAILKTEVDQLRQTIAELATVVGSRSEAGQDDRFLELTTELSILRSEIDHLRSAASASPQLASTNDVAYALAFEGPRESQAPGLGGIEISGFFDVVNSYQSSAGDNSEFGLGQAEIDLASDVAENIAVEVAVAYNNETAVFELGAAIIDIHLFGGGGEGHARSSMGIDHSFLVAGQFDVPFGIDYNVYASPDRKLITTPQVVEFTHAGWNDFGVQFGLEAAYGNLLIYAVNGFESSTEVLDEVATLASGFDVYEEVNTTPANAFGSRVGIAPIAGLEFGTSFAFGLNQGGKSEMYLWGGDVRWSFFKFDFKGEYITHSLNRSIAEETNKGYYLQTTYNLNRAFFTTRYGSFQPYQQNWVGQASIGAGYVLADGVELRIESLINEHSDNSQNFLQLVAGF